MSLQHVVTIQYVHEWKGSNENLNDKRRGARGQIKPKKNPKNRKRAKEKSLQFNKVWNICTKEEQLTRGKPTTTPISNCHVSKDLRSSARATQNNI